MTYEQFTRALTKLGLNLPDYCFKILARQYMDKNNTREVNYATFLEEVDAFYKRPPKFNPDAPSVTNINLTDF